MNNRFRRYWVDDTNDASFFESFSQYQTVNTVLEHPKIYHKEMRDLARQIRILEEFIKKERGMPLFLRSGALAYAEGTIADLVQGLEEAIRTETLPGRNVQRVLDRLKKMNLANLTPAGFKRQKPEDYLLYLGTGMRNHALQLMYGVKAKEEKPVVPAEAPKQGDAEAGKKADDKKEKPEDKTSEEKAVKKAAH